MCTDFSQRLVPGSILKVTATCQWNGTWENDPAGYTCASE